MWWIPLLTAAAGAYMGAQKNKHDQEIEDAQRKLQSNLTRYSWVNGAIQGDPSKIPHANSMFGDIGQGAMGGAMFGSQFMGNNPKSPNGNMAGPNANAVSNGGAGYNNGFGWVYGQPSTGYNPNNDLYGRLGEMNT